MPCCKQKPRLRFVLGCLATVVLVHNSLRHNPTVRISTPYRYPFAVKSCHWKQVQRETLPHCQHSELWSQCVLLGDGQGFPQAELLLPKMKYRSGLRNDVWTSFCTVRNEGARSGDAKALVLQDLNREMVRITPVVAVDPSGRTEKRCSPDRGHARTVLLKRALSVPTCQPPHNKSVKIERNTYNDTRQLCNISGCQYPPPTTTFRSKNNERNNRCLRA